VPFEGLRVVLIGPAPYARTWNAGRCLQNMPAELTLEGTLTPEAVSDWLGRLAAAPREKRG
jgi:hypothetical protein